MTVGEVGTPYVYDVTTTSSMVKLSAFGLPAGLTFTDNGNGTGSIAGTPTAGGSYRVAIRASDAPVRGAVWQTFDLTIRQAPAFVGSASAAVSAGRPFRVLIRTSGDPAAAITESGALPSGVTFRDNGNGTATLAGDAATMAGTATLSLTASNGVTPNATETFTLTLAPATTTATRQPPWHSGGPQLATRDGWNAQAPVSDPRQGSSWNWSSSVTAPPAPSQGHASFTSAGYGHSHH